eukprot:TRINITY_DN19193_c0_g1_i1.p1 TRINITY_DN19193_c0_g1~~TRINITY_DN19193_c0_g1_i1.p1  ORF type:complete len:982 (+),score=315.48 TRINITY_DN19193_c0_g1_i1:87-2948(+)
MPRKGKGGATRARSPSGGVVIVQAPRNPTERLQRFLGSEVVAMVSAYERRDEASVFFGGPAAAQDVHPDSPLSDADTDGSTNWRLKKLLSERGQYRPAELAVAEPVAPAQPATPKQAALPEPEDDASSAIEVPPLDIVAKHLRWQAPIRRPQKRVQPPLWRLLLSDGEFRSTVARETQRLTRFADARERAAGPALLPRCHVAPPPDTAASDDESNDEESEDPQSSSQMDRRSVEVGRRLQLHAQTTQELHSAVAELRRICARVPGRESLDTGSSSDLGQAAARVQSILDSHGPPAPRFGLDGAPPAPDLRFPVPGYFHVAGSGPDPPLRGAPGQVAVMMKGKCAGIWGCSSTALRARTMVAALHKLVAADLLPASIVELHRTSPGAEWHLRQQTPPKPPDFTAAELSVGQEVPPNISLSARVRHLCRDMFSSLPASRTRGDATGVPDLRLCSDGFGAFVARVLDGCAPSRSSADNARVVEDSVARFVAGGRGWPAFYSAALEWLSLFCRPLRTDDDASDFLRALREWVAERELPVAAAAADPDRSTACYSPGALRSPQRRPQRRPARAAGWDSSLRRLPRSLESLLTVIPKTFADDVRDARTQYMAVSRSSRMPVPVSPTGGRPTSPVSFEDPLVLFRSTRRSAPQPYAVGTRVEAHGLQGAWASMNGLVGTVSCGRALLGPNLVIATFPPPHGELPLRVGNLRSLEQLVDQMETVVEAHGEHSPEFRAMQESPLLDGECLLSPMGGSGGATPSRRNVRRRLRGLLHVAALRTPTRRTKSCCRKSAASHRSSHRTPRPDVRSLPSAFADGEPRSEHGTTEKEECAEEQAGQRRAAWLRHVARRRRAGLPASALSPDPPAPKRSSSLQELRTPRELGPHVLDAVRPNSRAAPRRVVTPAPRMRRKEPVSVSTPARRQQTCLATLERAVEALDRKVAPRRESARLPFHPRELQLQ